MERLLTIFWLLLIPTQLGRHFWLKESSVFGVRIDYLSIILYLTDIVWVLWIGFKIRNEKGDFKNEIKKRLNFQNLILIVFVGINIIYAGAKWVALYRWLRIGQWWLTWQLVIKNKVEIKKYLGWIVPIWIILESFLGLAQIIKGGSLNGLWWWLGERRFTYGGIGIAQLSFLGEGWIRAYGTFSHPNSLAGFLLLGWWWWKKMRREKKLDFGIWYWMINWSAVMGIALSGSRIVWGITIILLIVENFLKIKPSFNSEDGKKYFKKVVLSKILLFLGVGCLILSVVSINYRVSDFLGGWDTESFKKRELLAISALKIIKSNPLFGVGAGNFLVVLPEFRIGNFYWMQPVHNIFLLIWSEIGFLGILLLIVDFKELILKLSKRKYWWIWVIVGITGMLDHYWLTLPQNFWILVIVLGLI